MLLRVELDLLSSQAAAGVTAATAAAAADDNESLSSAQNLKRVDTTFHIQHGMTHHNQPHHRA